MNASSVTAVILSLAGLGCGQPTQKSQAKAKPAASTPAPSRTVPAWKVVSVHDGDTLRVLDRDNVETKVRLLGIDAPETGQAFGTKSRDALATMVKGRAVELVGSEKDRYGRTLATVMVDGLDANLELVPQSLAWHFTRYSKDKRLAAAEREAKAAKRGLWADPEPVAP